MLSILCLAFAIANVVADWRGSRRWVLMTKIAASTSFLLLGVLGLGSSTYGRLVVAALAFSWVGDVLLVSRSKTALLGGIAAFLFAHLGYTAGFAMLPLHALAFVMQLLVWGIVAALFVRKLWGRLDKHYRIAVAIYSVAIVLMVSFAAGTLSPLIAIAACLFVVSDISVARDRFIHHSISNKIWGIPLYYSAQVLFAISVWSPLN